MSTVLLFISIILQISSTLDSFVSYNIDVNDGGLTAPGSTPPGGRQNWYIAKELCNANFHNMASIHSDTEYDTALGVCVKQACWIGLTGDGPGQSSSTIWFWTDGSPTDYGFNSGTPDTPTNIFKPWHTNNPNSNVIPCIMFWKSFGWDDRVCDATSPTDLGVLCRECGDTGEMCCEDGARCLNSAQCCGECLIDPWNEFDPFIKRCKTCANPGDTCTFAHECCANTLTPNAGLTCDDQTCCVLDQATGCNDGSMDQDDFCCGDLVCRDDVCKHQCGHIHNSGRNKDIQCVSDSDCCEPLYCHSKSMQCQPAPKQASDINPRYITFSFSKETQTFIFVVLLLISISGIVTCLFGKRSQQEKIYK